MDPPVDTNKSPNADAEEAAQGESTPQEASSVEAEPSNDALPSGQEAEAVAVPETRKESSLVVGQQNQAQDTSPTPPAAAAAAANMAVANDFHPDDDDDDVDDALFDLDHLRASMMQGAAHVPPPADRPPQHHEANLFPQREDLRQVDQSVNLMENLVSSQRGVKQTRSSGSASVASDITDDEAEDDVSRHTASSLRSSRSARSGRGHHTAKPSYAAPSRPLHMKERPTTKLIHVHAAARSSPSADHNNNNNNSVTMENSFMNVFAGSEAPSHVLSKSERRARANPPLNTAHKDNRITTADDNNNKANTGWTTTVLALCFLKVLITATVVLYGVFLGMYVADPKHAPPSKQDQMPSFALFKSSAHMSKHNHRHHDFQSNANMTQQREQEKWGFESSAHMPNQEHTRRRFITEKHGTAFNKQYLPRRATTTTTNNNDDKCHDGAKNDKDGCPDIPSSGSTSTETYTSSSIIGGSGRDEAAPGAAAGATATDDSNRQTPLPPLHNATTGSTNTAETGAGATTATDETNRLTSLPPLPATTPDITVTTTTTSTIISSSASTNGGSPIMTATTANQTAPNDVNRQTSLPPLPETTAHATTTTASATAIVGSFTTSTSAFSGETSLPPLLPDTTPDTTPTATTTSTSSNTSTSTGSPVTDTPNRQTSLPPLATSNPQPESSNAFRTLSGEDIQRLLLEWTDEFPSLIQVSTGQQAFEFSHRAGGVDEATGQVDCPYDQESNNGRNSTLGCLNWFAVVQDYERHPLGSSSSNRLPTLLLSGALHGNERVGPTAVMETTRLLLLAAHCESVPRRGTTSSTMDEWKRQVEYAVTCREQLQRDYQLSCSQRQWLARLVTTRRLIIVPTANALGYFRHNRTEDGVDVNRDFPYDRDSDNTTANAECMQTMAARTLNELFRHYLIASSITFHAGQHLLAFAYGSPTAFQQNWTSPDHNAQNDLARAFSTYGGGGFLATAGERRRLGTDEHAYLVAATRTRRRDDNNTTALEINAPNGTNASNVTQDSATDNNNNAHQEPQNVENAAEISRKSTGSLDYTNTSLNGAATFNATAAEELNQETITTNETNEVYVAFPTTNHEPDNANNTTTSSTTANATGGAELLRPDDTLVQGTKAANNVTEAVVGADINDNTEQESNNNSENSNGGTVVVPPYPFGPGNSIIYAAGGIMEDWAYAGSWDKDRMTTCHPNSYGGYPEDRTHYDTWTLRAFNFLVETSDLKSPPDSDLGTKTNLLMENSGDDSQTNQQREQNNGYIPQNVRLILASTDLVQPYTRILSVNHVHLIDDLVPLHDPDRDTAICQHQGVFDLWKLVDSAALPVIAIPQQQQENEFTLEWTVGGAIEIATTNIWLVPLYSDGSGTGWKWLRQYLCDEDPTNNVLTLASVQDAFFAIENQGDDAVLDANHAGQGRGYFAPEGAQPRAANGDEYKIMGPVFSSTLDLQKIFISKECPDLPAFIVIVSAQVDVAWQTAPEKVNDGKTPKVGPVTTPQSHMVWMRRHDDYHASNDNGYTIQGQTQWFSQPVLVTPGLVTAAAGAGRMQTTSLTEQLTGIGGK